AARGHGRRARARPSARIDSRRVKVLLVGSGGREHALAWKLARSPSLTELHCAPGNPGIARHARCHPVQSEDADGLLALALELSVHLVVIRPEAPLLARLAASLPRERARGRSGVAPSGPTAAAAAIEGSKLFAKDVMTAAGVPRPRSCRPRRRRA